MEQVLKRHFYALDMTKTVERVSAACHTCASLKKVPDSFIQQSTEDPPEAIAASFAADVLKRNRQLILVVRESVLSFTSACVIEDE